MHACVCEVNKQMSEGVYNINDIMAIDHNLVPYNFLCWTDIQLHMLHISDNITVLWEKFAVKKISLQPAGINT